MFCTQFVQFSTLSQSNLQRVTFCTQTGSCHSGGCIDPENAKVSTACSSTFYVPTSTLNLHPSRQLLKSKTIHWKGWQLFALWCHCWGCLTITAAVSSSVDAYVCTIWTNPATCDRSTVSPCVLQSYYRAQTFFQSLKSRRKMGRRYGFETNPFEAVGLKDCFLAVGLHVSLIVEMRGRRCQSVIYCCNQ